jgi:hypothetical protein
MVPIAPTVLARIALDINRERISNAKPKKR